MREIHSILYKRSTESKNSNPLKHSALTPPPHPLSPSAEPLTFLSIMGKYAGEQILVIKRELLDQLGSFQGANANIDHYLPSLMDSANSFFMDREVAEDDPTHKQLIPYCLFHYQGQIFHYLRGKSGGEARLHAKGSIGVGGHINPVDDSALGGEATYRAAVQREIEEELQIDAPYTDTIIGLINDDENAVGQVHLGVVHLVELTSDAIRSNEDCLLDGQLVPVADLQGDLHDRLESWSQLALTLLP